MTAKWPDGTTVISGQLKLNIHYSNEKKHCAMPRLASILVQDTMSLAQNKYCDQPGKFLDVSVMRCSRGAGRKHVVSFAIIQQCRPGLIAKWWQADETAAKHALEGFRAMAKALCSGSRPPWLTAGGRRLHRRY